MFFLTITLMFIIGPWLVSLGNNLIIPNSEFEIVNSIQIENVFDSDKYLGLEVKTTNNSYSLNYYLPEEKPNELLNYLMKNSLINESWQEVMPIYVENTTQRHDSILAKGSFNKLEVLKVNGQDIIGSSGSIIKKWIYYLFGFILSLIGTLGLFLTFWVLYSNIKIYKKKGHLPEIPNSIDRKIEGIKYIFRIKNGKR